jgi:hypothetical protein
MNEKDLKELQDYYDSGKTYLECQEKFGYSCWKLVDLKNKGLFKTRGRSEARKLSHRLKPRKLKKHSEKTRKEMSGARKANSKFKKTLTEDQLNELQDYYNLGNNYKDCREKFGYSFSKLAGLSKQGLFKTRKSGESLKKGARKKMSEETKMKISKARKKYLKENPDKHPWRNPKKFISEPCELLKKRMKDQNIDFIEEYIPLIHLERYYSIDIAFPDKKIGIEINGNQHYNRDGSLKKYYQKRHEEIENEGWKLYELTYQTCYREKIIEDLIIPIINRESLVDFDYSYYKNQIIKNKNKPKKISEIDPNWRHNPRPNARKVEWPTKEELKNLLDQKVPFTKLGKMFGVSDNAVRKWAKHYNLIN